MADDTTAFGDQIVESVFIEATPDVVFPYLVDSDLMTKWMGKEILGKAVVGEKYHVRVNDSHVALGEYQVVDSPSRVVFTFGWDAPDNPTPPGSSTVEITLTKDGDGTIVKLVHSGLRNDTRADHSKGWAMYIGRLAAAAIGGDPGPDPNQG